MDTEQKWTISEDVLKKAFGNLGIDDVYYPVFKEEAISCFNDIAYDLEPESDDYDDCINIASEYIKEYVGQIKKGKSKVYAHAYADAVNMEFQEIYCTIFAEAYELSIVHGQGKTEAFCFGNFCSDAADQGYWLSIEDFVESFHEDWQKNFYIDLVRRDYEQQHHIPMSLSESELLRLLREKLFR